MSQSSAITAHNGLKFCEQIKKNKKSIPESIELSHVITAFRIWHHLKLHSGKRVVLDVQLKQSKCRISAVNVNKSFSFYTEIKRQQIKLSLILGLERACEKFTSSVLTIHTTHVQELGRKNVDTGISSCRV